MLAGGSVLDAAGSNRMASVEKSRNVGDRTASVAPWNVARPVAAGARAASRSAIETEEILADSDLMDSITKSRADMRAGRIVLWTPRNAKTTKSI